MISNDSIPSKAAPALYELERGMELKKCRKCGCMKDALTNAQKAFASAEEPTIHRLLPRIIEFESRMEPIAYDCIGCKKCWGADATIQLANHFDCAEMQTCSAEAVPSRENKIARSEWPPYPGDYIVGNPGGPVAVCTLSDRSLPAKLIPAREPALAIAGRCDTENIGIEKIVLNLLANQRVRWLVLCGTDAPGHRAGDGLLHLKDRGVDANMRVLKTASWRPILKNLTLLDVARFREQIQILNLTGTKDPARILEAVRNCSVDSVPPLRISSNGKSMPALNFERITAGAPKHLRLDKAGFFIVLPRRETGEIICEHYENHGRLAHVVTGRQAATIASTVIERGFVTQLDHAAYLGSELAKAETALKTGVGYEQDAALGELSSTAGENSFLESNEAK